MVKAHQVVKVSGLLLALLALITFLNLSFTAFMGVRERYFPAKYRELVFSQAEKQDLSPFLVAAMIYCESRFGPEKVSKAGAIGMMQIKPFILQEFERLKFHEKNAFTKEDLYNAKINVSMGTTYVKYLIKRVLATKEREEKVNNWYNGNPIVLAIFSYHSGPTYILQDCLDKIDDFSDFEKMIQSKRPTTWKYAHDVQKIRRRLEWINEIYSYN